MPDQVSSPGVFKRERFPARLADLEFSMDVPADFVRPPLPEDDLDFDNPVVSAPLAIAASPVALALVTVAARPVYETGSVLQWIRFLAEFYGMALRNVRTGTVGGTHPAILAEATQDQDGTQLRFAVVAFEDGGRLVTAHGMCPEVLWPSFGPALTRAVQSVELARPKGTTRDLDSTTAIGWRKEDAATPAEMDAYRAELAAKREGVLGQAERALAEGLFDEAERAIMQVDSSIMGAVEISRMYERRLKAMVQAGGVKRDRTGVELVFRRAMNWVMNTYPDPHTEIEAENYEQGRAEDRARLIGILGYEPGEK